MVFLVGSALAKVLQLNFYEKIKSCPDLSRFSVIKWYCEKFFHSISPRSVWTQALCFCLRWRCRQFRSHANTAEESTLKDIFAVRNRSSVRKSMMQWGSGIARNGIGNGLKLERETIIYVRYAFESCMALGANTIAKACKFITSCRLTRMKRCAWRTAIWLRCARCTMRYAIEARYRMMRSRR